MRAPYWSSFRALRAAMPELVPTYERLCELAGGGDQAARFLSLWRPPRYLTGCSQVVWTGNSPVLIRNYDYAPQLCEGTVLHTAWNGRRVIGMGDCAWGLLDGMNEDGLAISLAFGGRPAVGDGFGMPLLLRYVLEFCTSVEQATEALCRVPTHMAYNVTMLDRTGRFLTLYLSPDRPAVRRRTPLATNHQGRVECPRHADFTRSLERERYLKMRIARCEETAETLASAFLQPPLYSTQYRGRIRHALYRCTRRHPRPGRIPVAGEPMAPILCGLRRGRTYCVFSARCRHGFARLRVTSAGALGKPHVLARDAVRRGPAATPFRRSRPAPTQCSRSSANCRMTSTGARLRARIRVKRAS